MKLTETHKRIISLLKVKSLDDRELADKLKMNQSGMRARISELKKMGYYITRKYTLREGNE